MTGKRPTLADVAARAGVSIALVSIAMRGAKGVSATTREHILAAAREIGYRPDTRAQPLRSPRTRAPVPAAAGETGSRPAPRPQLRRSRRSRLLGVQFGLQHPFHTDLV